MKIKLSILSIFCLILALGMVSCEGDTGPAGPAGVAGTPGVDGPAGPTGPEGPEGAGFQDCVSCHQSQNIAVKMFQYEHSTHATGGTWVRGTSATCAACHSSQGFLERVADGTMAPAMGIEEPLPVNCYSCHQIHSTFTDEDWALTGGDAVTFWATNETVDLGNSNQCINCHQARVESPSLPDPGTAGTFTITNKRYGPHHGAQGMMFTGSGAYKLGDDYTNSAHTGAISNACVNCHMATADGVEAGGHTFNVSNEDGDINTAGCVSCHDGLSKPIDEYITDTQTEIQTLLDELQQKLLDRGILNPMDLPYANASSSNPLELTADELGALYNFQYVREDQSLGVHNYKFAKKLLENSIAALN